ncbi:MAG: proprotein convertase P-domain-containing protein, partial [Pedosphaera parvula]|nr:proprotein convertase P-domain-containing protein [Pedosphaera parvula]
WTDPPGNPNVALKLVNDLDLVVYSLGADTDGNPVTNAVYYGNNFAGGTDFNQASDTNEPPAFDIVNNVENIFLKEPLETNYLISVIGRRVNVNAVTTNDTDVVQDFALVISSGLTNALKELTPVVQPLELRAVTSVTNGVALLNQRVGANPAMLPQTPGLPNSVGLPAQWTFYVFTNEFNPEANSFMTNGTNVAFVTFLPPDLARPRTLEADIDLYVSRDPNLTNLVPAVVAAADKSITRGGTELVVYTNAPVGPDAVFYIGVKSEDQQAAEYAFVGLSSNVPFEEDINGSKILRAPQILVNIPDGSPNQPGGVNVLAIGITPLPILRTVVTNTITHDDVGDLLGNLTHNNRFSVLNNHRLIGETNSGIFTFVYDDTDQKELGWQPTDGPGSLTDFVGELSSGVWLLTMVDNSLSHTGRVDYLTIRIDPDLTGDLLRRGHFRGTVGPGRFAYFIANVPPDASQLDVFLSDLQPSLPLELYLRYARLPDRTTSDKFAFINPPGGKLSLSVNDVPPLNAGLYFIGVYNPNNQDVSFDIEARVLRGYAGARYQEFFSPDTPLPILDDAITNSTIRVDVDRPIGDIRVGLRLDHPRASDLVLHLVSPQGTRFLLAENRGLDTAVRYGGGGGLPELASFTG